MFLCCLLSILWRIKSINVFIFHVNESTTTNPGSRIRKGLVCCTCWRHFILPAISWDDSVDCWLEMLTKNSEQVALLSQWGCAMLSVCLVSFNSTIPRKQSFIISYYGFRLTTAYNSILFCCLRRNVEPSCHKHFFVGFREQQTTPLTSDGCHQLVTVWCSCM